MLKFEELLKRWHDGGLSGAEAGEFWGCSERQFRRYRQRYEKDGLDGLVDYNPVYHLLQIVRAPLLQGDWPTMENYAYCLGLIAVVTLLAVLVGRSAENKVIFYL